MDCRYSSGVERAGPSYRSLLALDVERVLPGSPSLDVAVSWLGTQGWRPEAERFSEEIWSRIADKVATVGSFFDMFPQLPRADVALEYLGSTTGSRLVELPGA